MANVKSVVVPDRRRSPRARARVSIGLQADGQVWMAQTRDFSLTGMYVETTLKLAEGTKLDIFFIPPGASQSVKLIGTVARICPDGLGIAFAAMSFDARAPLISFLSTLSGEEEGSARPPPPPPADVEEDDFDLGENSEFGAPPAGASAQLPDEFNPMAIEAALAKEQEDRRGKRERADELHVAAQQLLDSNQPREKAISLLQQAIALSPGVSAFHHDLGTAYYQAGDLERAVKEFEKALQLEPEGRD